METSEFLLLSFILHYFKEHLILLCKDNHFPMKYNSKTRILCGKINYF